MSDIQHILLRHIICCALSKLLTSVMESTVRKHGASLRCRSHVLVSRGCSGFLLDRMIIAFLCAGGEEHGRAILYRGHKRLHGGLCRHLLLWSRYIHFIYLRNIAMCDVSNAAT